MPETRPCQGLNRPPPEEGPDGGKELLRGAPDPLPRPEAPDSPLPIPPGLAAAFLPLLVVITLGAVRGPWSGPSPLESTPPPSNSPLLLPRHRVSFAETPPQGIALGLFSQDPSYDYSAALTEIRATGAQAVELVVPHFQSNHRSSLLPVADPRTPPWWRVRRTIETGRQLGLQVHLLPVLLLRDSGASNEHWRGTIAPTERERWHLSYRRWMVRLARRAEAAGVTGLCVGSELNSMQGDTAQWRHTVAAVRAVYSGAVTYSANWDSYGEVGFAECLDSLGVTAYHPLADHPAPSREELIGAWLPLRSRLLRWQETSGVPIHFTEVGYPSVDGGAMAPWDYTRVGPVDLEEQRDCLEAFTLVWQDAPARPGVFFYCWWGLGGPSDPGYTPRGKPALATVERWLRDSAPPRFQP